MNSYLEDAIKVFRQYKSLADRAMQPLSDEAFFRRLAPHVNSIAVVVRHVGGNLASRWTDFLTTDGEKPGRNRDGEFAAEGDTREAVLAKWEAGWNIALATIAALTPEDLPKIVTIRGEPHTVTLALQRSLAHTSYHVGQIMYLARLANPDGEYLTMPPSVPKTV